MGQRLPEVGLDSPRRGSPRTAARLVYDPLHDAAPAISCPGNPRGARGRFKLVPILIGLAGGLSIVANVILRGMILLVNPESLLECYSQYVGLAYALRFLWMLVWVTLSFFIKQWQYTRVLDRLHAAPELKRLRQQVNPHFLLSALNSILPQAHEPGKVTLGVESLADYLRFSL